MIRKKYIENQQGYEYKIATHTQFNLVQRKKVMMDFTTATAALQTTLGSAIDGCFQEMDGWMDV